MRALVVGLRPKKFLYVLSFLLIWMHFLLKRPNILVIFIITNIIRF